MSKKTRLKLENVKVQSFVTSLSDEERAKANGGTTGIPCEILSAATGLLPWHWPCICIVDPGPGGGDNDSEAPVICQVDKSQLAQPTTCC